MTCDNIISSSSFKNLGRLFDSILSVDFTMSDEFAHENSENEEQNDTCNNSNGHVQVEVVLIPFREHVACHHGFRCLRGFQRFVSYFSLERSELE